MKGVALLGALGYAVWAAIEVRRGWREDRPRQRTNRHRGF